MYMGARRYGIPLRVFNLSHERAQRTRYPEVKHEKRNSTHILFWLIRSLVDPTLAVFIVCGPLRLVTHLLYRHTNDDLFDDFPKIPKVVQRRDNHFPKFSRKNRLCFDHTGKHLSTF